MHEYLNTLVFGIYPYIALSVLAVGSIVRYEREPYTWRSGSSQLLRRKQLIWGSVLFHVGVLIVFFGHLVGLLTPIQIFDALGISHGAKQILAIVVGGVAGLMALAGASLLLHRRLFDPRIRRTSSFGDIAILALLYLQLLLGLLTIPISMQHLDGGEMVRFMTWAQGIFTFRTGAADAILTVHPIFKLHLFLGLTIFLVFPFTRLVHMLSAPLRYLWRPGYQVVRGRNAAGQSGNTKHLVERLQR
ncbi:respiratory nitrate reductase subunit gamma [Limibacillus halophilus]|uniref:nitrate reductase (quinone) n=1 Tax=Limibacillus halophilus TaxID=1579333 RepID=A0A839SYY6_9PROT|nr:respiratory nitrate reductase subunit gamma [Limibacillus halophilus]MBB3066806.1 nitrate reductase gamma subunit [Limibacillus halophilus]